ncbi:ExeM/NucH family extracellular endonuclease [Marinobacter sp.]|uniref:ExeM/NucH family extracellular endonuclease n=1 Tax=Marinobacter sp. TaxID=50741 RepID=UPI00384C8C25
MRKWQKPAEGESHLNWLLAVTVFLAPASGALASECGQPADAIAAVQGHGDTSPMAGQQVTVEGIVTFDARYPGGFGGFYLQTADDEADDDPATSEAVFVYTRRTGGRHGQRLRISGQVKEHHGLTELTAVEPLTDCGQARLPAPIRVSGLWPDNQLPESLENMRVAITHPLTVIDNYGLARYGQLTLAESIQFVPTQYLSPGPEAFRQHLAQEKARLILDDGRSATNLNSVPWPPPALSHRNTVRSGDQVSGLHGVLDYRFGDWRLHPLRQPVFKSRNPRPGTQPEKGGNLRVATINLHNYFNGDGSGSGFKGQRGADSRRALAAQTARLKAAVENLEADVITLMELENDGYGPDSALATLTAALGRDWQFVPTGKNAGQDAIRVGMIYRTSRVETQGIALLQRGIGRPAMAQSFRPKGKTEKVRIVAAHFKSKSCRNAGPAERGQKDGQGCYANVRRQAAVDLAQWLDAMRVSPDHTGTLVTGDLNSYAMEAPLQVLREAGFRDMVRHFHGPLSYTYRYRGRAGTLDYVLADQSLATRVHSARVWHANADEPRALAYDGSLAPFPNPATMPWRSSDHDPVVTDLILH